MNRKRRLARVAAAAAGLSLVLAFLHAREGDPASSDQVPVAVAQPLVTGQWIWSQRDAEGFAMARREHPSILPAVLVANIDGAAAWHRRLSPSVVPGPVAVVVRVDDAFHAAWDSADEVSVRSRLVAPLLAILAEVKATGADVMEVQLDYDAPVRRLAPWGRVVRELSQGPLAGVPVWVTSLPSHVASRAFRAALYGAIAGHIIQVFDTGLPCNDATVASLSRDLSAKGIAFRIGVGAFERGDRTRNPRATDHGCWLDAASAFRAVPGFSGTWVFGAAQRTHRAFDRLAWRGEEAT